MTDRLREALETLAERTPPADPDEFAARVLAAASPSRRRWVRPALVAAAAVLVVAVALPLLDDDNDEVVLTRPTTPTSVVPPTWRPVQLDISGLPSMSFLTGVAARGARVVAVGHASTADHPPEQDAVAFVSDDGGSLWTRAEGLVERGAEGMQKVTAVDDGFVAVGWAGPDTGERHVAIWRSSDGHRWTRAGGSLGTGFANAAASGRGRVVAVGTDDRGAAAWYSDDDGRTWRQATVQLPTDHRMSRADAVIVTPTGFVMAGSSQPGAGEGVSSALFWTSSDGLVWARGFRDGEHTNVLDVAAGPGGLVAVGGPSYSWTSTDGTQWSRSAFEGAGLISSVVSLRDGTWLAASGQTELERPSLWTSADGRRWQQMVDPTLATTERGDASDVVELVDEALVVVGTRVTEKPRPTGGGYSFDYTPVVWLRR